MKLPFKLFGVVAFGASLALAPAASAQLYPGGDAPVTQIDAMEQAHSMSCFLAAASRPVPGLNFSMPENMGEGHFVEETAPDWLVTAIAFEDETNFSRVTSLEGDIWIAFELGSKRCTVAAETDDAPAMRETFVSETFERGDWERKRDRSAFGYYYKMELGGLEFRTEFPDIPAESGVFAVQVLTD